MGDIYLGLPVAEYQAIEARLKGHKRYTIDSLGRAWGTMPDLSGVYLLNGQPFFPERQVRPQSGIWTAPDVPPTTETIDLPVKPKKAKKRNGKKGKRKKA